MRRLFQRILLAILANALALYVCAEMLQDWGFEITRGVFGYASVGFVLGVLNTFVRPFLKIVGLPFVFLSMGLFLVVINAVMLYLVEYVLNDLFTETFRVYFTAGNGIVAHFVAAVVLSVANTLTHWIFKTK